LFALVLMMAVWLACWWDPNNFWAGMPRVAYSFGAGVLIFRANSAGYRAPRAPYWAIAAALVVCTATDSTGVVPPGPSQLVIVLFVLPTLVALAVQSPVPDRLVGLATWLGAISYPLYAVHYPILQGFGLLLDNVSLSGGAKVAGWCLAGVVAIALAAMIERFYDAPIRMLLRDRRSRRPTLLPG
jgi:peptidoglycan/LPS O-acetylase OafA/YrhL